MRCRFVALVLLALPALSPGHTTSVDALTERGPKSKPAPQRKQAAKSLANSATPHAGNPSTRAVSRPPSPRASRFSPAYDDALTKFRSRQYRQAIEILQWLLKEYPDHRLAGNCHYWIGECYFGLGDYDSAQLAFRRVLTYPNSPKKRDAQLMLKRALKSRQKARA
jgi:TolA-binding protein